MNKFYLFAATGLIALLFTGCSSAILEIDVELLQEKIYNPTVSEHRLLKESTVLYLDHSTCVIDAARNSAVFKKMRPNLGQYSDNLLLIKGQNYETIPLNRQKNKVSEVLETITQDIPFADIRKAVFQICNDNQQAILITDCESHSDGRFLDFEPYMTEPFVNWLKKGYVIYIVTEPYQENYKGKIYDKKRFYFFFTDDYLQAPINNNLLGEINAELNNGLCSLFKLTNSDLSVQRDGEMVEKDLDIPAVESKGGFEYVEINSSWDDIREYVMKLDKYGEPLPEEKPAPIIKNLVFNEGENYLIRDIEIVASNITAQYSALCNTDSTFVGEPAVIAIPDGFTLDKDALKERKLNVMLTDKIFNYLTDEFGGNLIRLDFVIKNAGLKQYDETVFTWQSIYRNDMAICISKSIDNALRDINVIPTGKDRQVIHTVFIKTEAYK